MHEMLRELSDPNTQPFGVYQPYVKHVSDDRQTYILRFDNGYGALVTMPDRVYPIGWRPSAKTVHDYYDAGEYIICRETFADVFEQIAGWGPPPTF
jgi:hypothetical protein